MPKKSRGKSRKDMKNKHNEGYQHQEEERTLRQLLKEIDLYKRGMNLEEMRELYTAVELSKKDHEIHQKTFQFDVPYPENPLHRLPSLHRDIVRQYETEKPRMTEQEGLQDNSHDTEDLNFHAAFPSPPKPLPSPARSMEEFEVLSPYIAPRNLRPRRRVIPKPMNVDSDSDECYSPAFPGPCCRVEHIVQAEIHPAPREINEHRLSQCGSDSLMNCMNSFRKKINGDTFARSDNEWNQIDELV